MTHWNSKVRAFAFLAAGLLLLASCTKTETTTTSSGAKRTVRTEPGVAGGTIEESFTSVVTVEDVNPSSRRITIKDEAGQRANFVAGPEVKNLDRIRAGDKFNATITERLEIFTRSSGEEPSQTAAKLTASAPKGAVPGMLVSEKYELVAKVTKINPQLRTATLQFADGMFRTFPVREDVDLSRYSVGDNVVIRVSAKLNVLKAQ